MRRSMILLMSSVVLATAGCSAGADYSADATVTACTPAPGGGKPVADGQVTNSSAKPSNYTVRVSFFDSSNNKVTDGFDAITNVEAGSSSPWRVTGLQSVNGAVDCRIAKVTRNVVPGG